MRPTRLILAVLVGLLLAGCRSEPERLAVSGSVSLDGKAVSDCIVVFQSVCSVGSAYSATATITNGRFEILQANGLAFGEYGVVFTEVQPDLEEYEAARIAGAKNALNRKTVPAKYTVANALRINVSRGMQPILLSLKSR